MSHCAISWKVTGSIPIEITGIFQGIISPRRTTAWGSTQPLNRKGYQEYILGGKGNQWSACAPCLEIMEASTPCSPPVQACNGIALFISTIKIKQFKFSPHSTFKL
jgi:hypothetical protein